MATRRKCEGSGRPAIADADRYPSCPVCGRSMAAQGRKASRRYVNAWQSIPTHYVDTPIVSGVIPQRTDGFNCCEWCNAAGSVGAGEDGTVTP